MKVNAPPPVPPLDVLNGRDPEELIAELLTPTGPVPSRKEIRAQIAAEEAAATAEAEADWAAHRDDPDNWIKIPDFGVRPSDTDDEGFGAPILAPWHKDHQRWIRQSIREMVKTARALVRTQFSSLDELNACYRAAVFAFTDLPEVDPVEIAAVQTSRHSTALGYRSFIDSMDRTLGRLPLEDPPMFGKVESHELMSLTTAIGMLASGAASLVAMTQGKYHVVAKEVARLQTQPTPSEMGKIGGEGKHKLTIPHAAMLALAFLDSRAVRPSRAETATEIMAKVNAFARANGEVPLKPTNAKRTITQWLGDSELIAQNRFKAAGNAKPM